MVFIFYSVAFCVIFLSRSQKKCKKNNKNNTNSKINKKKEQHKYKNIKNNKHATTTKETTIQYTNQKQ